MLYSSGRKIIISWYLILLEWTVGNGNSILWTLFKKAWNYVFCFCSFQYNFAVVVNFLTQLDIPFKYNVHFGKKSNLFFQRLNFILFEHIIVIFSLNVHVLYIYLSTNYVIWVFLMFNFIIKLNALRCDFAFSVV